mgnify:FL=1
MKIQIHSGQNQIGGSIIEISTDNTKVIFDAGVNLDESDEDEIEVPQIDGLFCGEALYDAVFVSHYHGDHVGLLPYVLEEIPIYMGRQAANIVKAASEYRGKNIEYYYRCFEDGQELQIGELSVTPIMCDHSAYDSFMFLIEADDKKILYSGDFRSNGRMEFANLLKRISMVDVLVIEGTTLTRETYMENIQEELLEDIAEDVLNRYSGPAFLMTSAMNVERIITGYNASRAANRIFLEDLYTAGIMSAIDGNVPVPEKENGIRVFMTGGDRQYELIQRYPDSKFAKAAIAKEKFLMCIRPSMKNYLKKLNEICPFNDGVLFYGMWKGYLEREDMQEFIAFMENIGVKIHILHTSGHADVNAINALVEVARPKYIIPVHTENPDWYTKYDVKIILDDKELHI